MSGPGRGNGAAGTSSLQTLGQILRERREAYNVSLAEVEKATRIRQKYLAALESEEWHLLPGEVVGRGFLRNYALYLNLDAEALIERRRTATDTDVARLLASTSAGAMLPPARDVDYRPKDMDLEEVPLSTRLSEAAASSQDWFRPIVALVAVLSVGLVIFWGFREVGGELALLFGGLRDRAVALVPDQPELERFTIGDESQNGVGDADNSASGTSDADGDSAGVVTDNGSSAANTAGAEVPSDAGGGSGDGSASTTAGDSGGDGGDGSGAVGLNPQATVTALAAQLVQQPTNSPTPEPPAETPEVPTDTPEPPTDTPEPPTPTPVPPTPVPPTPVPVVPTDTPAPPTPTPAPVVVAASCPDGRSVITSPGVNQVVSGQVPIVGSANHEQFNFYKLEFAPGAGAEGGYGYFDGRSSPVGGGVLGNFNSGAVPNGSYTIQLTVVDQTGNYPPPCRVTINVQN